MDDLPKTYQSRTDAKLRYAKVHLEELELLPSLSGSDFDRAHQESFLFHLFGARDAFLIELNHYYQCRLPVESLSQGKIRNALKERGESSPELAALYDLEQTQESWLSQAKAMRDHSTHIHGVPRVFHVGGEEDGKVQLRNPRTKRLTENHVIPEFRIWLQEMHNFLNSCRQSAMTSNGF